MSAFFINNLEQLTMMHCVTTRQIVKDMILELNRFLGERPMAPCLRDMEALLYPPMKDKTHLLDGRTLEETWPERKAKILALPDRPPEELFLAQLEVNKEREAFRLHQKELFKKYRPNYVPEIWTD